MANLVSGKIGLSEMPGILSSPGFAIQNTDMDVGAIRPNSIGLMGKNPGGLELPAGTLVYQIGWDLTSGFPTIGLATAAAQGKAAQWVTAQAIPAFGTGLLAQHYAVTGINTNAATLGDPVYLSGTSAGGYSTPSPTTTALIYQIVGHVAVKSATVGVIHLDLFNAASPPRLSLAATLPTVGTAAGAYTGYASPPVPGTIVSAYAIFATSLGVNGTNFVTISATDGATPLLATGSPVNSTFTGGVAITAGTKYPLALSATPANLVVAADDLLAAVVTVTGTLGTALAAGGEVFFRVMPS